ncbi:DNA-binding response regulator, OmpR family, contains REC and winged-helix (wHTH) domain [Paenibacillus sp. UNCCL117]|uniref:response regulator transcription factor n=1 Tax=unclassified Paenibacillus TaxID=185978 RepID=UPI00088019C6|nr:MULTISPECIES: response regulator transcription factor [unclassified Paenibacillus]SDC53196.1 DNA-binding response regulator, OmpR family, contains REC and winged-helix (wHTH) domain [Paenibacillus sp. cl123]SFW11208.1 DNA-binding response regulator, OmpR family, contains REC and winged-helix (wHTH) domain [Paenibacillus sp. UNCCL117]
MRVLVVEDDKRLLDAIASVLEDEQYQVDCADNGREGLLLAGQGVYDLLILDIMLPAMDGISVIQELRKRGVRTPCLFLTAKDSVESRVRGLDAGADDYLVKPFAIDELLARLRALHRRKGQEAEPVLAYGGLSLSAQDCEAVCGDKTIKLTAKEYDLLAFFIRHKEQIVKRDQVFARVWGMNSEANETAVDLYVHYLRKKLSACGCEHYIRTVRSVGYMLKAESVHV